MRSVLLSALLLGGCYSSFALESDDSWRDAPSICEPGFASQVPREPPCADAFSNAQEPSMLCRGDGPRVWIHRGVRQVFSATCETYADDEFVRIDPNYGWCPFEPSENSETMESLTPCDPVGYMDDIRDVLFGEERIALPASTCTATRFLTWPSGCSREPIVADFVADDVCVVANECGEAQVRISGPHLPLSPNGEAVRLNCEHVRYEAGRISIDATPVPRSGCGVVPAGLTVSTECVVPPNIPRAALEVWVNGARVGDVDFRSDPDCD